MIEKAFTCKLAAAHHLGWHIITCQQNINTVMVAL
jgi:hypothetical protein